MPMLQRLRDCLAALSWRHYAFCAVALALLAVLGFRYLLAHQVPGVRPVAQSLAVPRKGAGELTARNQAQIASRTALKVSALFVEAGQVVQRGQPLLALDATELQAQARSYEAAWHAAQMAAQAALAVQMRADGVHRHAGADARRAHFLAGLGSGAIADSDLEAFASTARSTQRDLEASQAQWEAARQSTAQAEHNLQAARARLDDTTLRAPFDGMVTARQCSVGDTLSPGAACLTVVETGTLYIKGRFDESVLGDVAKGDVVTVRLKSQPGRAIRGQVERVNWMVDADTREFTADITLDSMPSVWALGERATVEIVTRPRPAVLTIPLRYLVTVATVKGVWTARDGRAEWTPLHLGLVDGMHAEVVEGLDSASVVLDPHHTSRWMRVEPRLP